MGGSIAAVKIVVILTELDVVLLIIINKISIDNLLLK